MQGKLFLPLAILAVLAASPFSASAEPCETSDDCAEGFECVPSPCATCAPGEECPECGGGECMARDYQDPKLITNIECSDDTDCPSFFACEELPAPCGGENFMAPCECPACDPESDGECPECDCGGVSLPDCDTSAKVNVCTLSPAECSSDSDCPSGWECATSEVCSGGGGCSCPGCAPGEECEPCDCDQEFESSCEVIGSWCEPKVVSCETTPDCAEGWTCGEVPGSVSCACADCACSSEEPECNCPPCECETAGRAEMLCLPDGWDTLFTSDVEVSTQGSFGSSSGEERDSLLDAVSGGASGAPGGGGGGEVNGEGGGGGPSDPNATAGGSGSSGGCSANGGSHSGVWFAALLVAGMAMRRRRQ